MNIIIIIPLSIKTFYFKWKVLTFDLLFIHILSFKYQLLSFLNIFSSRFVQTYFSTYPGYYFTGDGALRFNSLLLKTFFRISEKSVDSTVCPTKHDDLRLFSLWSNNVSKKFAAILTLNRQGGGRLTPLLAPLVLFCPFQPFQAPNL